MTVVEYDGRIVVVDVGCASPRPEMGRDRLRAAGLHLLRERADDIEGIVVTHGHEDHLGALPFVRAASLARTGHRRSTAASWTIGDARSKLDEHKLRDLQVEDVDAGADAGARPVQRGADQHDAFDPDCMAVALTCDVARTLITGDYKFRPDSGRRDPADVSRLAELGREGVLLLCGTPRTSTARVQPIRGAGRPAPGDVFSRCEGRIVVTSFASNIHRVSRSSTPRPRFGRKVSLSGAPMART